MTPQQAATFEFVRGYIAGKGYAPAYAEIATAVGVAKSRVQYLLLGLEAGGHITRIPRRSRAIQIAAAGTFSPEIEAALSSYCSAHRVSRAAVIAEAVSAYLGVGDYAGSHYGA